MKIILFRFEKEKINFVECEVSSGNLTIGKKEIISLESTDNRGEKYNKIEDELRLLYNKYSTAVFAYQSPQKNMGRIMDEEGFSNSTILHLFCYQNNIALLELTAPYVRKKLDIPQKEFKELLEKEKEIVSKKYNILKSNKILDGATFVSLLRKSL